MESKTFQPAKPDAASLRRLDAIIKSIAADPSNARAGAEAFIQAYPNFPPAWRVAALAARQTGEDARADQLELKAIAIALDQPRLQGAQQALA